MNYAYSRNSAVYLYDVSFSDIIATGEIYGLIFVYDDYNVMIDRSHFENIENSIGLVHCRYSSYCNVTIKNSVFRNNVYNNTDCVGAASNLYYNRIYFEANAYGTLFLHNCN